MPGRQRGRNYIFKNMTRHWSKKQAYQKCQKAWEQGEMTHIKHYSTHENWDGKRTITVPDKHRLLHTRSGLKVLKAAIYIYIEIYINHYNMSSNNWESFLR